MKQNFLNRVHFKVILFMVKRAIGIKKGPVKVGLQITKRCNLNCVQCSVKDTDDSFDELDIQEIEKVLLSLNKLGCGFLVLTGGEPLLRGDICQIVELTSKFGYTTALATNGTILTKEIAEKLKFAGLSLFHLSLDAATADKHDAFRGEGSFKKTLQGIRIAVATGLPVCVTTTITRQNKNELEEIVKLLEKEKVQQWSPIFLVPCGQAEKIYHSQAVKETNEILALFDKLYIIENKFNKRIKIYIHDPHTYFAYLLFNKKASFMRRVFFHIRKGCGILNRFTLYINSDGTIKPCAYYPESLKEVNVKTHDLKDVFITNGELAMLRNKRALKGQCRECRFLFCCGGCRAKALIIGGDHFVEEKSCPFFLKR